jgi:hypothetical protein
MNNEKYQTMYRAIEALLDDTMLSLRTQVKEALNYDPAIDDAIWEFARDPELCRGAFGDEFAQNLLLLNSVAESVSLLDDLTHFSGEQEKLEDEIKEAILSYQPQNEQTTTRDVLQFPTEFYVDPYEQPDGEHP